MDVRFCEGRNHRREAQVRAADTDEYGSARSSEARVRRTVFSLDKDLHGSRQTGSYPETGLWEASNSVSNELTKVNVLWPNPLALDRIAFA
jgi:hypothetical protein